MSSDLHSPPDIKADHHIHTEWSFDAPQGSMTQTCEQALVLGLHTIGFTEHAEFVGDAPVPNGTVDITGYHRAIADHRSRYPDLRILSGVEFGQPHRFPAETEEILAAGPLDLILGSVHCVPGQNGLLDLSVPGVVQPGNAIELMHGYLGELRTLLLTCQVFEILAHLDFPKRYWPHGELAYRETDYEEEFRDILTIAARRGLILEINTTRGRSTEVGLLPDATVLRWWEEQGGQRVSFGSDAHDPSTVAKEFVHAAAVAESCGFGPVGDSSCYWGRQRVR